MVVTSKKVAKKVGKKATKRSRHAGKIAPALVAGAGPLWAQPIQINPADVERVEEVGRKIGEACVRIETAASAAAVDPDQKQLHRRVALAVYDAAGARISNTVYDLAVADELTISIDHETISGLVRSESR